MGQGNSSNSPARKYRLLLVGITGSGKSSLGNAILGQRAFSPASGMLPGTQSCFLGTAKRDNMELEVVDTPGFCDQQRSDEDISETITVFLAAVSPGPHAVLVVMKASDRYTPDVDHAYKEAKKLLGKHQLASRIVLVFTGGDVIKKEKVDFEAQIRSKMFPHMKEMLEDAGQRYVLFNNNANEQENKAQLEALLKKVHEACMPDFSYLSSELQENIEKIINNESKHLSKEAKITLEEANLRVRKAMIQADCTDERLMQAIAHVKNALSTQQINITNNNFCTIL